MKATYKVRARVQLHLGVSLEAIPNFDPIQSTWASKFKTMLISGSQPIGRTPGRNGARDILQNNADE
ncbi:hypothetical protein TRAPUB_8218 [Trametes pubescens]|uniref:Uncharacterized protein n=1 Tax=Trametes pubescens TaxID=154538 RepID=A0A1M2W5W4_TRAPU|nr:hypothetical protein TRAPUB_8218 [Trametes pubescens]